MAWGENVASREGTVSRPCVLLWIDPTVQQAVAGQMMPRTMRSLRESVDAAGQFRRGPLAVRLRLAIRRRPGLLPVARPTFSKAHLQSDRADECQARLKVVVELATNREKQHRIFRHFTTFTTPSPQLANASLRLTSTATASTPPLSGNSATCEPASSAMRCLRRPPAKRRRLARLSASATPCTPSVGEISPTIFPVSRYNRCTRVPCVTHRRRSAADTSQGCEFCGPSLPTKRRTQAKIMRQFKIAKAESLEQVISTDHVY